MPYFFFGEISHSIYFWSHIVPVNKGVVVIQLLLKPLTYKETIMRKPIPRAQRQAEAARSTSATAVDSLLGGINEHRHLLTSAKEQKALAAVEQAAEAVKAADSAYELMKMSVPLTPSGTQRLQDKANDLMAALREYGELRSAVHALIMKKLSK